MLTVGQVAENCFVLSARGCPGRSSSIPATRPSASSPRSRRRASTSRASCSRIPTSTTSAPWRRLRGRPGRRSGARRSRLRCWRTSTPSSPGRAGPRGLRGRPHGERWREAAARRARHRRDLHPGHSPGHVTYSIPGKGAIFSGDAFEGSVGRTDLPGGDWPTLLESIRALVDRHPPETTVYPGHMGITTLGAERQSNPFLQELLDSRADRQAARAERPQGGRD